MKKTTFLLLTVFYVSILSAQSFKVTLQTPDYKKGIAYLTYHMGKNLNVEDSAAVNSKGVAVFTGQRKLPGGIYAIVFPGKNKSVDFFIDKEQIITIKADTSDLLNKTIVIGSKENNLFQEYQKFIASKGNFLEKERAEYAKAKTKEDSLVHEKNFSKLNKELNDYREGIIKKYPTSMMAVMLNAMKEPKMLMNNPVTRADSLENYYYYKQHYWDGVTFMDDRLVRTPFFLPKLERYYRDIIPQSTDTIIKESDYQILLARTAPEMYKLLINWLTDEYIYPKYMGQDAVFVHLFENYHSKGISNWLNEKQQQTISKRAYMLMANLIGEKAANLEMVDTAGKPTSLYTTDADFTVVCFWDPTCGHCKEEVPRLDSIYHAEWKKVNVKMFGVLSADIKDDIVQQWTRYINDHKLNEWVNVYQTKEMRDKEEKANQAGYHQLYDVTVTPTLYLLDKEKRIIGKKLTWEQINDLLKAKLANKK
jgi:thiol-disulfide isomerase/thioredoxin